MNQPQPEDQSPHARGRRNGIKWAITWLHEEARQMNDPHAKLVLNNAAFHMSNAAKVTVSSSGDKT